MMTLLLIVFFITVHVRVSFFFSIKFICRTCLQRHFLNFATHSDRDDGINVAEPPKIFMFLLQKMNHLAALGSSISPS